MKTILLIEDNPELLDNLDEFLQMEGYRTILCKNGIQGIELAQQFRPDLIICDVRMQGIDGHEVLRGLLRSSKTNGIPFIFSTSLSEKLDRTESMALGADDYIVKPFELGALLKMSKAWIESGTHRPCCGPLA